MIRGDNHLHGYGHSFGLLVIGLSQATIMPLAGAMFLAFLCKQAGWQNQPALFWVMVSPVLYLFWLFFVLIFFTIETSVLGLVYTKPKKYLQKEQGLLNFPFVTSIALYGRFFLLHSLPLVSHLIRLPFISWLILRAYSTKTHLGIGCWLTVDILDPDLTTIGSGVTLGAASRIIAHSLVRATDGYLTYQTAPIELGECCTIGGAAQIELGVKVGAHSVVEPCSRAVAFTNIPPGEIWGGSPAVFLAKRENIQTTANIIRVNTSVSRQNSNEIQKIIAHALSLPVETMTNEISIADCPAWDSLSKMAIASALYNRFGLSLSPEVIFTLDSVEVVEQVVANGLKKNPVGYDAFYLPSNPELLPLLNPAAAIAALAARQWQGQSTMEKKSTSNIHVAIAATFVAQPLASSLQLYSRAFGLNAEVDFFDFNQAQQALLSPESSLRKNLDGLNVVLLRLEDFPGANAGEQKTVAEGFLHAIKIFTEMTGRVLLVSDLPPVISPNGWGAELETNQMRIWWRDQLQSMNGVEILDFTEIVEEIGKTASRDARMELEARIPYSLQVYQQLGIGIARGLRKMLVPAKKVLALDCDGTLWGGVIGEDGMDGIQLGDDAAGRCFKAFQKQILSLKQRGILLMLVSKNLAEDVWNVIDHHSGMILRRNDFVAAKINWKPKSENLHDLASEFNLGMDSFVLFDDNPVERMEVEAKCPQVTVIPLSAEPSRYSEILQRLWLFDGAGSTIEDVKRNDYMQQEIKRKSLEQSTDDLQFYLSSLKMKVEMRRAREEDLPRVSQLIQKTNQFNLSLKRRTLPEIRALQPKFEIWVVSASDRFGSYGLVGGCISRRENDVFILDSFLLSCRVLGRGVEEAFLQGMAKKATSTGANRLYAHYMKGPRNQPITAFLEKYGFRTSEAGAYELELPLKPFAPGHFHLEIE